jgi:hypothetical protein
MFVKFIRAGGVPKHDQIPVKKLSEFPVFSTTIKPALQLLKYLMLQYSYNFRF